MFLTCVRPRDAKKSTYGMRPTVREQVVPVGTEHFENWTTNLCGEAAIAPLRRVQLTTDYRPKERVLSDRSGSSATAVRVLLVEMTVAGSCVDLHGQWACRVLK